MFPAVSFLLWLNVFYCTARVIVYYANLANLRRQDDVIAQVLC